MKIKTIVKKLFYKIIFFISKIYCSLQSANPNTAIVMVPSWEGSIGDEAVIDSITNQLKKQGKEVTLIHFAKVREWSFLTKIDNWYSIDGYFRGNGFKFHLGLMKLLSKNREFYALGTDMLDGCYAEWLTLGILRIVEQASKSGLKTNIVGFSINTWQNENCIKALGALPKAVKLCVRDDVSKERLQALLPKRKLSLTSDMAFLLEPQKTNLIIDNVESWILEQKESDKLVLGINISPQLFNDTEKTNLFVEKFCNALRNLEAKSDFEFAFVLISHDLRDYNSDITILTDLYNKCTQKLNSKLFLIEKRIMASEIKYIAGMLDVVVTGRMHLSIASLGQGTPIGCMVYQGKFQGLFNHFDLPEKYLFNPRECDTESELLDFITLIVGERNIIKDIVTSNLKHVKSLSKENLT